MHLSVVHAAPAARASARGHVRRSLRLTVLEGIVSEWVGVCAGGAALTAWALHLHAPPPLVAAVGALPAIAQCFQIPAARVTARFGARRVAIAAALAARQPWLALVALPFLPLGPEARLAVLVAVAASAAVLGAFAHHAWSAWTAALFRAPIRGRVLARRTSRVVASGAAGAFAVGLLLDRAGGGRDLALAALALVAWGAGLASARLLSRHHAPRAGRVPARPPADGPAVLGDARVRRGLRYVCAWNAALGLTATASSLWMLHHLRLGFSQIALHGLGVAAGYLAMAPLWGRALDRHGVGRVLAISTLGAAALPFLWLATSERTLWPVAVDAVLGGMLLSGHSVAVSTLPVAVAPRGRRGEVLAAFSAAAGISFAASSIAGGWLVQRIPFVVEIADRVLVGRKLLFVAGGTARLGAALLGMRVFRRRAE